MNLKVIKKGFNYSQDGTGNRLVFHLQGCNLHCPWCANPESIPVQGVLMVHKEQLISEVCRKGAVQGETLDRKICRSCMEKECLRERKNLGLSWSCQEIAVEALLEEAKESRPLFFDGGGVTVSGGEPTLQLEALKELLKGLKELGIHTAIETNGTCRQLPELFPYIDLLIMDFKHPDDEILKKITGGHGVSIKENLKRAMEEHGNVWIRTPLIHGFNGMETYIPQFLECCTPYAGEHVRFEFLKYHEFGKEKWEECGFPYTMQDGFVSDELREAFEHAYRTAGLQVVRT